MLTLPFTVAVFMVRSFTAEQGAAAAAPGGDAAGYEAHVGRLTGMLVSSLCLCMLCVYLIVLELTNNNRSGLLPCTFPPQAAVYSLAQLTTSYAWGVASDAVGRKVCLCVCVRHVCMCGALSLAHARTHTHTLGR
jgi:hypothetical protein